MNAFLLPQDPCLIGGLSRCFMRSVSLSAQAAHFRFATQKTMLEIEATLYQANRLIDQALGTASSKISNETSGSPRTSFAFLSPKNAKKRFAIL
jgi:hypothetical protein